jgi:hypothetical protein
LFILTPLAAASWQELWEAAWMLAIHVAGGIAFTLSGLYVLFNFGAIRFDREQGRMFVRGALGRRELELSRIRAVQLISGGWHTADNDDYQSFQLNLVLDDAEELRRPLLEHTEALQLRREGQGLADFLNIPFLNQLVDTPNPERAVV